MTKQPMNSTELIPNIALRNTIQLFLAENPEMKNHKREKLNKDIERNIIIESAYVPESKLYVRLKANDTPDRKPSAFIFVIDVSGSMDTEASPATTTGESDGFSRLDLVKHSVRTVIEVLEPNDQICLITFSDDAKLKLDFTQMTTYGKNQAINVLDSIRTEGMTNIWDGLRVGLLNISKLKDPDTNISLVLLTDGEPNKNPPRGIEPTLQSALANLRLSQSFTINTFGFGYALDSKLLNSIAKIGSGTYGYIPDSSMVGTIFVNYLSNVLSTYLSNSKLRIKSTDKVLCEMNLGPIQYEQPKEIIFDNFDSTVSDLKFELIVGDNIISSSSSTPSGLQSWMIPSIFRYKIMSTISHSMATFDGTQESLSRIYNNLEMMYQEISSNYHPDLLDEFDQTQISNYLLDWKSTEENKGGQISSAFSRIDWYNKWGSHFLRSLMNGYMNQQCNNFKDPGVQHFGGSLFKSIRQEADDAFCMLPAPKPSVYKSSGTTRQVSNMTTYYNAGGSCYDGFGLVAMADDTTISVQYLQPGNYVKSLDSNGNIIFSKIKYIVKSKVSNFISMCEVNGFLITPWHPIIYSGQWVFPINVVHETNMNLNLIYNVVLENGTVIFINDTPVITLGHGLAHNPVVTHSYYGTNNVVSDLENISGQPNGIIMLDNPSIMRTNGLVTKLFNN
jgi:Mg-chelatase subunit ChlD